MSHQRYGPLVGVPRILGLLEDLGVPATFFVPGWTAERYPETVERILAAGHEVGSPRPLVTAAPLRMDEAEERRDLEAGLAALEPLRRSARGLPDAELGAEPADVRPARGVRLRLRLVAHGRRPAVRARDCERAARRAARPLEPRRLEPVHVPPRSALGAGHGSSAVASDPGLAGGARRDAPSRRSVRA